MDIVRLCYICGRPAVITCKICGRPVCEAHQKEGICINCLKGRVIDKKVDYRV